MLKEYVSLIVPCYNVAKTLQFFIDSVLNQTYPYIQLIAVNDGSTDDTEKILKDNIPAFEKRNIKFDYILQDNAGLGAAINAGLKHIEGEYLCWADPDDFLMCDSFEKKVEALKNHQDCAVVTSDAYIYDVGNYDHPIGLASDGMDDCKNPNQFISMLNGKSIFCCGCHMIRVSAFDDVNPDHDIYPARRGQNWQLLLPLYYKYMRYFLPEPLYGYVIYPDSMSSGDNSKEKIRARLEEHENIIIETLSRIAMKPSERDEYIRTTKIRFAKQHFYNAISYRDKKMMKNQYEFICGLGGDSDEIRRIYKRNRNIFCKAIGRISDCYGRVKKMIIAGDEKCHHV